MMFQYLGHTDTHDIIMNAIETVLCSGMGLTPDVGGKGKTEDLGKAIADAV